MVTILYFAWVRQKTGRAQEVFPLPAGVTNVTQLMERLAARGEGFAEAFRAPERLRCAVNQRHAGFDTAVKAGDEIAFFPPVTGGCA